MIVDVHAHLSPPEAGARFPMPPSLLDVEGMIERKLAAGIDLSVIGSPVGAGAMAPIPGVDNYAQPDDRLAVLHDWLAGLVAVYPAHLRAWAYVNPFGTDAQLATARDLVQEPGFVGFIVNSSVNGDYLGAPAGEAFFAMAAEACVPLFVHPPARPVGADALRGPALVEQVGRFLDVGPGVASVVLGGWLERHPGLRLLVAGGGGPLALLGERLDRAQRPEHWGGTPPGVGGSPGPPPLPRPPSSYFDRIWVDTAVASATHLEANLRAFGSGRLVFGTDGPPILSAVEDTAALVAALPLDGPARARVLGGNACELLALGTDRDRNRSEEAPP